MLTDWSGDGGVSVFDFTTYSYWFGIAIASEGGLAPDYADVSRDGGISVFDFSPFSNQFGMGVRFPAAFAQFVPLGDDAQGEAIEEELPEVAELEPEVIRATVEDAERASLDFEAISSTSEDLEDALDEMVADIAAIWSN